MSRSSRHVARDRITSSRLSRQLASGGAPFIFRRVSEAAPSSHCRRSSFSKQRGSCSGDRTRMHLSFSLSSSLSPSLPFPPRFSPVFLFSIFPTSSAPLARHPSHPFAFLRVVRAYEFDFTRFPSIGERRKLFLEQPISPCPPFGPVPRSPCSPDSPALPRTPGWVPFFFVSLTRLPKRGAEKKAINEETYARPYTLRGSLDRFV